MTGHPGIQAYSERRPEKASEDLPPVSHERALLFLVLAELVLIVAGAVVDFAPGPLSLAEPSRDQTTAPSGGRLYLLTALWVVVAVGTVSSWVGLLCLAREARPLYLGSWCAYLLLNVLRGPAVETAAAWALEMLMALVGGGILGLVYFSELRTQFRPLAQVVRGAFRGAA